ncbi:hypothetical protein GCM10023093_28580 [Nemorincola caseinilytica]|uniref:Teneurin NHL domain-containing protein n=2 Tax=Nemorincola caseinilytica TaxID=2054315 RepID=A0ABP8NNQ6_9BACT
MVVCAHAQVITTISRSICTTPSANDNNTFLDLRSFNGIAVDGTGNIYVTEWNSGAVLKVSETDDCMKVFAGSGDLSAAERGSEKGASILYPHGIAADKVGNIYVAQYHGCVVRRISPDGTNTIVAGNKICGYNRDGKPATATWMGNPNGVTIDGNGNMYIADEMNQVVLKVTPDGYMVTYAGTSGLKGYSGDRGSALVARLNMPYGLAAGVNGDMYISDTKNHVVRRVDAEGIITTVAGNGSKGYEGDGGPATAAKLHEPRGIAVDGEGNLYIADENNHVVRKVTPAGIISTYAGNGRKGHSRDGAPATAISLTNPRDVAVDDDGNLYIIDFDSDNTRRIHKVAAVGVPRAELKVSPGQTAHYIRVDNCTYTSVTILDASEKVMSEQAVTGRSFQVSIAGLAPGNYILDFRKPGMESKKVRFSVSEQ